MKFKEFIYLIKSDLYRQRGKIKTLSFLRSLLFHAEFKYSLKAALKKIAHTLTMTVFGKDCLNTSRFYLEKYLKEVADSLAPEALVLDAGCGSGLYRPLFSQVKYESADFCQVDNAPYDRKITYVCDLSSIPVEDGRYNLVVCTQVLEHVLEPKEVLKEFYRIIKPAGKLVLSVPFFHEEHQQPYDYYRYTQFGIRHLLSEAGFEIEKLNWLEGYYGALSYQLQTAACVLQVNPKAYGSGLKAIMMAPIALVTKMTFRVLAYLFGALDIRYKNVSIGYCKNYIVSAVKTD